MPVTPETKQAIFNKLKAAMLQYSPPMVVPKKNLGRADAFELIGNTPVPYGSKKVIVPGMFFVSIVNGKSMVSFHFFPIYMNKEAFKDLAPLTMKCLKGKSCFNFTKVEQVNEKEIAALLKKGVAVWKKLGYVK